MRIFNLFSIYVIFQNPFQFADKNIQTSKIMENNEKNIGYNWSQCSFIELLEFSVIYCYLCICLNWIECLFWLLQLILLQYRNAKVLININQSGLKFFETLFKDQFCWYYTFIVINFPCPVWRMYCTAYWMLDCRWTILCCNVLSNSVIWKLFGKCF